jgi:hypothetical protein
MSLCFAAIRLETITRETRSTLLRISFFLVWKLYEMHKLWVDKKPEKAAKGSPVYVTIFTTPWTQRFLNTVLLHISAIETCDELAIEREYLFSARYLRDAIVGKS